MHILPTSLLDNIWQNLKEVIEVIVTKSKKLRTVDYSFFTVNKYSLCFAVLFLLCIIFYFNETFDVFHSSNLSLFSVKVPALISLSVLHKFSHIKYEVIMY